MAITLAEAKLATVDAVELAVIDEFRKNSWLMDNMTFDDIVNPAGGGGVLTYGYRRLVTPAAAAFRELNSEYVDQHVTTERVSVDLGVLGGSFAVDRIIAGLGAAQAAAVQLNMSQKIKSTNALFNDAFINGDSAATLGAFDGIDKALTGSSTEFTPTAGTDWSVVATREAGLAALRALRTAFNKLDGRPTAILTNEDGKAALESIADYVSQLSELSAFGQTVTAWRGVPIIDMGAKSGSNDPIIPTSEVADSTLGTTSIYVVRLGLDGVHTVSTMGGRVIRAWAPDFSTAGAVKRGEVEMGPVAPVIRATKAAAVIRGIKVA